MLKGKLSAAREDDESMRQIENKKKKKIESRMKDKYNWFWHISKCVQRQQKKVQKNQILNSNDGSFSYTIHINRKSDLHNLQCVNLFYTLFRFDLTIYLWNIFFMALDVHCLWQRVYVCARLKSNRRHIQQANPIFHFILLFI